MHFDGADFEALTYRVSLGEVDSDGRQALQLHALIGDEAREDSAVGALRAGGPDGRNRVTLGSGQVASPTGSTSTCRYSELLTRQ